MSVGEKQQKIITIKVQDFERSSARLIGVNFKFFLITTSTLVFINKGENNADI